MRYFQVDVFAAQPFSGNGLGVFPEAEQLSSRQMQVLTEELRQFECIFLSPTRKGAIPARIFTVEEELPFAGHPVLGAGAVLHHLLSSQPTADWSLELSGGRRVELSSRRTSDGFTVEMGQGPATFGTPLQDTSDLLSALNLSNRDLSTGLPLQVVSTGLPYLLVPLAQGLERARIQHPDFEQLLSAHGAKFVYLLDVHAREGRTWDNRGAVEDAATGSAAGPAAAYLVAQGLASAGTWLKLVQGRLTGRPSELMVQVAKSGDVAVRGSVFIVGEGTWSRLPPPGG